MKRSFFAQMHDSSLTAHVVLEKIPPDQYYTLSISLDNSVEYEEQFGESPIKMYMDN